MKPTFEVLTSDEPKSIRVQLLLSVSIMNKINKDAKKYSTKPMHIIREIVEAHYR